MRIHEIPQKILITRLSSIGDILLATPLIRVLHHHFPSAQIDFLLKSRFSDLLIANPYLNQLIQFDDSQGFNELKRIKNLIRDQQYDWWIDIHKNLRSAFLKFRNRSQHCFSIDKRLFNRFLLVQFKINCYHQIIPVYERYLEPLKKYGIEYDNAGLDFFLLPEIKPKIQHQYQHFLKHYQLIIGMVPGAGFKTKQWPPEGFVETGDYLAQHLKAGIILFGGSKEQALHQQIAAQMKSKPLSIAGELSLQESAALMNHCHLVISNDSGFMHVAAALKKKLIAIFGSTTRELGFFPCSPQQIIIEKAVPCRPCSHVGRQACPKKHFRCMTEITPAEVQTACLKLLKEDD